MNVSPESLVGFWLEELDTIRPKILQGVTLALPAIRQTHGATLLRQACSDEALEDALSVALTDLQFHWNQPGLSTPQDLQAVTVQMLSFIYSSNSRAAELRALVQSEVLWVALNLLRDGAEIRYREALITQHSLGGICAVGTKVRHGAEPLTEGEVVGVAGFSDVGLSYLVRIASKDATGADAGEAAKLERWAGTFCRKAV